jgi:hypothetical protein
MNTGIKNYQDKIQSYLNDCYFDIGSTPTGNIPFILDEAHLAKMLTRIVVSAATVLTTTLSLKQYSKEMIKHYRKTKL